MYSILLKTKEKKSLSHINKFMFGLPGLTNTTHEIQFDT